MNKKKIVVFENIINENVKDVYQNLKVQKLHMCKIKWKTNFVKLKMGIWLQCHNF
jgi:hypothetical protein